MYDFASCLTSTLFVDAASCCLLQLQLQYSCYIGDICAHKSIGVLQKSVSFCCADRQRSQTDGGRFSSVLNSSKIIIDLIHIQIKNRQLMKHVLILFFKTGWMVRNRNTDPILLKKLSAPFIAVKKVGLDSAIKCQEIL